MLSSSFSSETDRSTIWLWKPDHPQWGWLSQWYESPFHAGDGKAVFNTAEQWMMYQKALVFGDKEIAAQILATKIPSEQQALGRKVTGFDRKVWDEYKLGIVTDGTYHKFKHSLLEGEDLKAKFLATGERPLVEASPEDRIWGIGYGERDAEVNRANWGENLLGKAQEAARRRMKEEEEGAMI